MEILLDVVSDGEEALDFLMRRNKHVNSIRPHIILLDLNLPKKNGIDVLKEVKANESLKKILYFYLLKGLSEAQVRLIE